MIKNFVPRLYQQTILATCIEKNTLVILPTGLGKTNVFLMLAAHRLKNFPEQKILFLGPTRPLISQYYNSFARHLEIAEDSMAVFTGQVSPEKREALWKSSQIVFSTPQGLENDVITGRIDLSEVSLLGFDEAHRAVGSYSYVWIASQYMKKHGDRRILGLTASPGSDLQSIKQVCKNLFIRAVEIRTDEDPDVKPYIHDVDINWIYVELPAVMMETKKFLESSYKSKIEALKTLGIADLNFDSSKRDLIAAQASLQSEIISGNRDFEVMKSVSLIAECMKLQHALELLETQGVHALSEFMEDIVKKARTSKVKAVKNLMADLNFRSALVKTRALKEMDFEHPKIRELKSIVRNLDGKIIVFSQFRDTIQKITDELNTVQGIDARMFVGQAKKKGTGLTQKEQIEMLRRFGEGEFNCIVMSSVGEEGLDIPAVETVIFYEPIPSAIRTIQRKGRTGRHGEGRVIVLVTKGTRDEGYRWSAHHKERRMHTVLEKLRKEFESEDVSQKALDDYAKQDIVVYADYREKGSGLIKKLIDKGIKIQLKKLDIGDYLLSSRVCVEYKTVPDFVDSIIDKRLLAQLKGLAKYQRPIILIEGKEDIFSQRNIHPNAIAGILSAIAIDYGIPIIRTKNPDETLLFLSTIARREQIFENKEFTLHGVKPQTLKEQQEYIISGLPGVGPVLARPLLSKFGSVKSIINASIDELKTVELIGEIKAKKIREIADSIYEKFPE